MERSWRFRFGMRTVFAIITIACVLLVGWNWATATRLWIEPDAPATAHITAGYGGRAMIAHGRFFCFNGPEIALIRLVAIPVAQPGEAPQFRYSKIDDQADRRWPGFYTFAIEVPAIGPRDRCDIGVKTETGAAQQISVGDLSLPPADVTVEGFGPEEENEDTTEEEAE